MESQAAPGRPGAGQVFHLLLGNIPVPEALQGGFGKPLHALPGICIRIFQCRDALHGNRILALRRHQFRAIHVEQRFALSDRFSGGSHMQFFYPALELGRDVVDMPLVDFHPAHRAHRFIQQAHCRLLGLHPQLLHLLDADLDLTRPGAWLFIPFVHRNVVHAHRVLLRRRRGIRQAHRVAVKQNLSFCLVSLYSNRRSLRLRDRARAKPISGCANTQQCQNANDYYVDRFHSSSPNNRSISAKRICASVWAFSISSLAFRVCRAASSKVAKSTLPFW